MYRDLTVFQAATQSLSHAGARQQVVARNVAHADTPGFRAMDIAPDRSSSGPELALNTTRTGHLTPSGATMDARLRVDEASPVAPNGNSVTLEREMVKQAELRHQHDIALSVYKSAMGVLRTSLGRGG